MSWFRVGEIVDITIKGARVTVAHNDPEDLPEITVLLECEIGSMPIRIPHHWSMVAVERRAPAEWPPQSGDLWRGKRLYFTRTDGYGNPVFIPGGNDPQRDCEGINQQEGPLTLVHREEPTP